MRFWLTNILLAGGVITVTMVSELSWLPPMTRQPLYTEVVADIESLMETLELDIRLARGGATIVFLGCA